MTIARLQHITKYYASSKTQQPVLNSVNLSIEAGEMIAIMGPSGSGKSTLLHILGLLDRANSGHYHLLAHDVSQLNDQALSDWRQKHIGFVFQQFHLLAKLSAWQNVALPLQYGPPQHNARQKIRSALEKVQMHAYAARKPTQLSGGQQQRIAIARALINQPTLLLADEPTGALDKATGESIMQLFCERNRSDQTTIIIVTHDEHIAHYCQRVIHIQDGCINEI